MYEKKNVCFAYLTIDSCFDILHPYLYSDKNIKVVQSVELSQ